MDIVSIVVAGIIGAVLSITLKKQSPEISLVVGIITGVIIILFVLDSISEVIGFVKTLAQSAGIEGGYIAIVLKVIAIAYIAEFGIELCKDAGENAIASKIELAGKVIIIIVASPIFIGLMQAVMNII